MEVLPEYLVSKVFLYLSTDTADIIKESVHTSQIKIIELMDLYSSKYLCDIVKKHPEYFNNEKYKEYNELYSKLFDISADTLPITNKFHKLIEDINNCRENTFIKMINLIYVLRIIHTPVFFLLQTTDLRYVRMFADFTNRMKNEYFVEFAEFVRNNY
jgi:hypothetical protein